MSVQDTRYVHGAERLARRIQTIRERLNLPALTYEIGELLVKRTDRRFETETDPDGRPWADLAPSTIKRKRREGSRQGKLQRSGDMREAIAVIRGGSGATFINTGASVRIGIDDPEIARYARMHQQGFKVKARRFLGIGALDVKSVDNLLRRKARELEIGV